MTNQSFLLFCCLETLETNINLCHKKNLLKKVDFTLKNKSLFFEYFLKKFLWNCRKKIEFKDLSNEEINGLAIKNLYLLKKILTVSESNFTN